MTEYVLLLTLIPLIGWGVGDFLVQKTSRVVGVLETLLMIALVAVPLLTPFIISDLPMLTIYDHLILSGISLVSLLYGLAVIHSFKVGKLSVVEAIITFELPLSLVIGAVLFRDSVSILTWVLMFVISFLLIVIAVKDVQVIRVRRILMEQGVLWAAIAALFAASTDVLLVYGAREFSPFLMMWYHQVFIGVTLLLYMLFRKKPFTLLRNFTKHPILMTAQALVDNTAWLGFIYVASIGNFALVATITQSYIIIAVLLGIFFNKERLRTHQTGALILAIPAVLVLAYVG